ncbi:hypothetical protein K501DRAFT_286763 [Backusella circina FSU 941]|nr:hypothetical protein K501DRAFT_286763 [Backusella circina FSU 941]
MNKRLKRRQTIGNLAEMTSNELINENAWNLRQKSVYTPKGPVRDPLTPMPPIMGPVLPPCTTGAQDNSGWFPMTMPPIPNTNSFMMPNAAPMMQPYFLPMPMPDFNNMTYPLQQRYMFTESRPNSAPETLSKVTVEEAIDKSNAANAVNNLLSRDVNIMVEAAKPIMTQERHTNGHTETMISPLRKTPALVQRRKSLVDELISSFSIFAPSVKKEPIYSTKRDPTSFASLSDTLASDMGQSKPSKSVSSPQQHSSSASSAAATPAMVSINTKTMEVSPTKPALGLSRKVSNRLSQKVSILSKRPYVWCYRPLVGNTMNGVDENNNEPPLWIAFDVNNQIKLDAHFQTMLTRNQGSLGGAQDTITKDSTVALYKQSKLPGVTIVATYHGMAWHYESGSTQYKLLEITRIQSDNNRFVVSNDLVEEDRRLRRSKSLDKLASKLFNTVLGK